MNKRTATLVVGVLDTAAWAAAALAFFRSGSDPATIGFDLAAGWLVTLLFVLTGVPALVLAMLRRAPTTALALALAFPAAFVLLLVAAVIAFA
jgi:hypothetical protein